MDPANHQHLYYASGGLGFESLDGGKTWSKFFLTLLDNIGALFLDPEDQSLYAVQPATRSPSDGVYQSGDHGRTWTLVGFNNIDVNLIDYDIAGLHIGKDLHGNKMLIANGDTHLYFSIDQGKSWRFRHTGCNTIGVGPQTPTTLYCGETNGGLSKSTDGGSSWKEILGANSGSFQAISFLAGASPRLAAGGTNVAISTDQGASWNNYESGLAGQQVDLTLDSSNASIFYLKYNDQYVDCHPLYRSIDAGRTWNLISSTSCGLTFGPSRTDLYRVDMRSYMRPFPNNQLSQLFHSTDQGAGWDTLAMPSYCERVYANPYAPGALIATCPNNSNGVFYSNDFGKTWQPSEGDIDNSDETRLFFGGSAGQRVYAIHSQDYRSDDGGRSWFDYRPSPINSKTSPDSRLIVAPQNPDHLLQISTGLGVLISTDGCGNWIKSNTGLGNLFINTLARDPKNINTIYAGTDGGAYVSFNGGQTWGQVNDGLLGATVVYSIVVDPQSNVYAATPYGIFKLAAKQ
jgi:photosystem II stability/assembly factor-like uncharacterized protein